MATSQLLLGVASMGTVFTSGTFSFTISVSAGGTFTLPLGTSGTYAQNFVVTWGDGNSSTITSYDDPDKTHTYVSAGTKTVTLTGVCEYFAFNNGGDKLKLITLVGFTGDMGLKRLNFHGCENLITIVPLGILANLTDISYLCYLTAISSIPVDMFKYCPNLTNCYYAFGNCFVITSIPSNLFKYNYKVTSFSATFWSSSSITSIGTEVFGTLAACTFSSIFGQCYGLTSIPAHIFDACINATSFGGTFGDCQHITSIPTDIFRYNTLVTSFTQTFMGCSSLATVPANLFKYNTLATNFNSTFFNCNKLQQNSTIFYAAGESGTRFLNQSVNFNQCFQRGSFTGSQGTAPDLWNVNFGSGTPTKTKCWYGAGNSKTSLTNYNNIPSAWRN